MSSSIVPKSLLDAEYEIDRLKAIDADVQAIEKQQFDVTIHGRYVADKLTEEARKTIKAILLDHCKTQADAVLDKLKGIGVTING